MTLKQRGKMKVLFISTVYAPYHLGGAEISTKLLAEGLALQDGMEISVLTHGRDDKIEICNNVTIIRKNFGIASKTLLNRCENRKSKLSDKIIGKLADIFKNQRLISLYETLFEEFDVVILSGNCANMGRRNIWIAASKSRIKSIQILRDPILLYFKDCKPSKWSVVDRLYRMLSFKDNGYIDYTVSPTKALIEAHKMVGMKFNREEVIPNTVDDKMCVQVPFADKSNTVVYVGAVSKRKGCHTLIKAFEELHKDMPDCRLKLIGAVEDVEIPKENYIEVCGYMDIHTVYHNIAEAKLLVLPSEWEEAFGRVIIEAVYNYTVAIGSDRGGIPEIFGDYKEFVFKGGAYEELYCCMKNIMEINQMGYEKKLENLLTAFERFRIKNHIEHWNTFLRNNVMRENKDENIF